MALDVTSPRRYAVAAIPRDSPTTVLNGQPVRHEAIYHYQRQTLAVQALS